MKKNISIFTHAKKIFFVTYVRIVAILIVSVAATFLVGIGSVSELFYYVTGLNYFTPDFFSVFLDTSSGAPWMVPLGISISILAMFLLLLITFVTSATTAFVLVRNTSFLESIKLGVTKGLRSIPAQALFLALLVVSSIPSFLLILLSLRIANDANGALALFCILLGALLLLLPFFIGLRSVFVVFIWLENQKARAWSIVKKSFVLTQGTVIWMMVLAIVLAGAGAMIIHPLLVLLLSTLAVLPSGDTLSAIVDQIISIFLLTPIMYALFYTFYVQAKKRAVSIKKRSV